jgi:NAD(P)H-hydrate epimerase
MNPNPGALYTARQVRELDRRAIEDLRIPGYKLMTRAGHATLNAIRACWPEARTLTVVCGPGNNGGDGYVVARVARAQNLAVRTVALADPNELRGDARKAYEDFVNAGGSTETWSDACLGSDVIVDAIFGTGLAREVSGDARAIIESINRSARPVTAVDIPSGLHADTGAVLGVAVRAALTVTFIGRKLGFHLGEGPDHVGQLVFDALEVPAETYDVQAPSARLITPEDLKRALPRRPRTAHKGRHGHVLVVGGGAGMPGAARLAGEAALRGGAGLVTVAAHPSSAAAIAAGRPELMVTAAASAADIGHALERATVIALGPGLGQSEWALAMFETALQAGLPTIVDADALNLLSLYPRQRDAWVLTPHPGEAGRLLGIDTAQVQRDRLGAARGLAERYGGVAVLKGAGTIVQAGSQVPRICDRGNPGMATGGMGDVLTGLIAGIAGQCEDLVLAACAGVLVHAEAGDRAASDGERGLLASDVLDQVRDCVNPT